MSTVADRPRARKARAPRPAAPIPQPNDRIPEGWQPGGAAPAVAPARPAGPVERHGKCRLTLSIGGTAYRLRPVAPPPGLDVVWTLSKVESDRADGARAYAVASDGCEIKCTCPDHEVNGARCKHIGALVALRLIAPPSPARPAGPASPSPADQFRAAVTREVRRKRGEPAPCEGCGVVIGLEETYAPGRYLCGDCYEQGGAL